jgi:hypothetical protein
MDGKDATLSTTNWMLIAGPIAALLAANGVVVEVTTVATVLAVVAGFWGRWRAGGIKSVAGFAIPQPK